MVILMMMLVVPQAAPGAVYTDEADVRAKVEDRNNTACVQRITISNQQHYVSPRGLSKVLNAKRELAGQRERRFSAVSTPVVRTPTGTQGTRRVPFSQAVPRSSIWRCAAVVSHIWEQKRRENRRPFFNLVNPLLAPNSRMGHVYVPGLTS